MTPLEQLHIKDRKFDETRNFNSKFLGHVKQYAVPRNVPSKIEFLDDENLVIKE